MIFTNNADTKLSASITDSATSCTVTSGANFAAPTGGNYQVVTITNGTLFEVCRLTARTANTLTITRAQEGTAALAWDVGSRVFAGVTAGVLGALPSEDAGFEMVQTLTPGSTAVGADAVNIQTARVGVTYIGSGARSVCIGSSPKATGVASIALGESAEAAGENAVSIGPLAYASGEGAIAISGAALHGYALNIAALSAAAPDSWAWENAEAFAGNGAAESVVLSRVFDAKATATVTCPLPTGMTFYADEVGIIVEEATSVTGQPEISFGVTGDNVKLLAATATVGMDAAKKRQRFGTLLSANGETSYTVTVAVAATGTMLNVRAYWKGFAVQDEP